jgi:hypothetical protein
MERCAMGWPETFTLAATILVSVLGGIIYGNARLDDLRNEVSNRISDASTRIVELRSDLSTRATELRGDVNAKFAELRGDIDRRFGEMDHRFDQVHADLRDLRALIAEDLQRRAS